MKIKLKIVFSNIFNLGMIAFLGLFALQNLNVMNTKLKFVEIADDLNVSFLEMRLSEKNYFLYGDKDSLSDMETNIADTMRTLDSVEPDIVKAIGQEQFSDLETYLQNYAAMVDSIKTSSQVDSDTAKKLRAEGRILEEFSNKITRLERSHIEEIISKSKRFLFYIFFVVLLSAMAVSRSVSKKILRPLKEVEEITKSISAGNFRKIDMEPPRDELGSIIEAVNSMSEKLRTREEEIIQSKKLASMGILVAGVAHELNNPLNNISMISQTYTELYDKLDRQQRLEFMHRIEGETERIKEIVKNLLDFSKPKEPNLRKSEANAVLRRTLKLVQNMLDISKINTVIEYGKRLPPVFIDEDQIQQVLVNLIINAIQSMPSGGDLNISTRSREDKRAVEIEIKDTGKGIPREFIPHIFDPFFSTKEEGGTGLGLWVSYGIIKNHNGNIRVESTVGKGTVFTVQLPAVNHEGA